jgi:molecular chaperone HtpG
LLDGQLDMHFINTLESKFKDSRFVRVDSDIIDNLIKKDEKTESVLNDKEQENVRLVFQGVAPEQKSFWITCDSMSENDLPVIITRDEYMRRMKDMSALSGGTGFYGGLPDDYKVIINTNHPLIVDLSSKLEKKTLQQRIELDDKLEDLQKNKSELEKALEKFKKDEEKPVEEKKKLEEVKDKILSLEEEKTGIYKEFGKKQKIVSQLFDLALLANNLLKGESLSNFVSRSVELLKK